MSQLTVEALGLAAACMTTFCWAPQALRIIRTRDTRAISLVSQSAFAAGVALWFLYGVALGSWPIMLANAATFALVAIIVALKIRFG
jgi:MtN3 and saliva related transmembrane protein